MADRIIAKRKRRSLVHYYATIVTVLVALIMAAFFAPQLLFQVQDAIWCKDTVLSQQENMNVEALSTTYEQSLGTRMQNYAEGLAAGNSFYVTSQEIQVTDGIREYIYSDRGIYGELVSTLCNVGLLSYTIYGEAYTIEDGKQYVIYSNDYAKGVNFILWYIQLQIEDSFQMKLLVDAEDGTIYAIKTEDQGYMLSENQKAERERRYLDQFEWSDEDAITMWGLLARMYGVLDPEQIKNFEIMVNEYGWTDSDLINKIIGYNNYDYDETFSRAEAQAEIDAYIHEQNAIEIFNVYKEEWTSFLGKIQYNMETDDTIVFRLPYGDAKLDMALEIPIWGTETTYIYGCPDLIMGIRQIYEMIPGFA